jgi:LytS/YehU family sensor histidine kinase
MNVALGYLLIAGLAHAAEYARRFRDEQLAELRLQAALARADLQRVAAELRTLKMQLNPHFLFSSLRDISELIPKDPPLAQQIVVRLSELLRRAMHSVATQEVTLEEELESLRPFVDIEQLRSGAHIVVEWQVAEEALDGLVPHMILQPVVETVIARGPISVRGRRDRDWLELSVGNVGGERSAGGGAGPADANVQARLEQLYGARHHFEHGHAADGGTLITLRIPWHEEPVAAPALRRLERSETRPHPVTPPSRTFQRAETVITLLWLGCTWLISFAPRYQQALERGFPAPWLFGVAIAGLNAALWSLLLLGALRLTRLRPILREAWRQNLTQHIAAALGLGTVVVSGKMLVRLTMRAEEGVVRRPVVEILSAATVYAILAGLAHAAEYARRFRQKRLADLRLQADLARSEVQRTSAELRMLNMQLRPHFLFNALHAVALLVSREPTAAQQIVLRLSDMLHQAMDSVASDEISLGAELEGVRPFIEIERIRLGEDFRVRWDVAADARHALVPHMILQPLVENAIKHGIVPAGGKGSMTIAGRRCGEWLELSVRDTAAGIHEAKSLRDERRSVRPSNGVGSANVRARLEQLYGAHYRFELQATEDGGTLALLQIPWHEAPAEGPAAQPIPAEVARP